MNTHRLRRGFTLIELLVVLAIVGVLVGLLLCAVMQVRAAAARTLCANRLRQIGLALHGYHDTHRSLPSGTTTGQLPGDFAAMNWHVRLLPHLEQEPLWWQAVHAHQVEPDPYEAVGSLHPRDRVMPIFECPADPRGGSHWVSEKGHRYALTMYLGVLGTEFSRSNGVLYLDSRVRLADITDGTSNTLMVGECPPSPSLLWGWWYTGCGQPVKASGDAILGVREYNFSTSEPNCPVGPYAFGPGKLTNPCDVFHFWSLHSGGAHFVLADGCVRFVGYGAKDVMPALATRAGGEAVEVP